MTNKIFVDGASSGNPGKAGAGFVIQINGRIIKTFSRCVGKRTNNQAEYIALIYALREALKMKINRINVYSDSLLMVMQINGKYKVRSDVLKKLYNQAKKLIDQFTEFSIEHIPREINRLADKLAKEGIKKCKNLNLSKEH